MMIAKTVQNNSLFWHRSFSVAEMLDPRRLRLLVEFDRRGTVASVAAAMSYTPSAVSQQLAALEREAGVTLFEHVGRRMFLTDLGRLLVADSAEVLDALERTDTNLERASRELRGVVRLASISSVGMTLLPRALVALEEKHPGLAVEYVEADHGEAFPWLDVGEIDLVIGARHRPSASPARYDEQLLCRDPLLVALAPRHRLASRRAVPLAELAQARWVSARIGTDYDEMLVDACRAMGSFEPDIRHRAENASVIMGLVAAGAVAIVPSLGWRNVSGAVVRPLAGARLEREVFSCARICSARRPTIQALRAALREAWEQLPPLRTARANGATAAGASRRESARRSGPGQ
jgi:DNA-binding transcriptional LysR family regulator